MADCLCYKHPMTDTLVADTVARLEALVTQYKRYERNDRDRAPERATCWSPRSGFIRVAQNATITEGMFHRNMGVGVQIGAKFGIPKGVETRDSTTQRLEIVSKVENEVKTILEPLVRTHGGAVLQQYGSAFTQIGWVARR